MAGDERIVGLYRLEHLPHERDAFGVRHPEDRGRDQADDEPAPPAGPWLGGLPGSSVTFVEISGAAQVGHDSGVEGVYDLRMAVTARGQSVARA